MTATKGRTKRGGRSLMFIRYICRETHMTALGLPLSLQAISHRACRLQPSGNDQDVQYQITQWYASHILDPHPSIWYLHFQLRLFVGPSDESHLLGEQHLLAVQYEAGAALIHQCVFLQVNSTTSASPCSRAGAGRCQRHAWTVLGL